MSRERCLEAARDAVVQRGAAYGKPGVFFAELALRWSLRFGVKVTPRQVLLAMLDFKLLRAERDGGGDSAVDIAGYAACLFELDAEAPPASCAVDQVSQQGSKP